MINLKSCPFCGEMLQRKHVRKTKSRNGYDYYQHPCNECILAGVEDGFPLSVYSDEVDNWNRRAESPSPKPTDPLPIRGVEYVPTEVDVKTGTVTYELRERSETKQV